MKLLGNLSFNPLLGPHGGDARHACAPRTTSPAVGAAIWSRRRRWSEALGVPFARMSRRGSADAKSVRSHKTFDCFQDSSKRGKPLEIDALVTRRHGNIGRVTGPRHARPIDIDSRAPLVRARGPHARMALRCRVVRLRIEAAAGCRAAFSSRGRSASIGRCLPATRRESRNHRATLAARAIPALELDPVGFLVGSA